MGSSRQVGGLWCFEVLERLSDYVDGELTVSERAQVEAHLTGCEACTQFGGEFGALVRALRERLGVRGDVPAEVGRRLEEALATKG